MSPNNLSSQNAGTPPISRLARIRDRISLGLTPGNQEATSTRVAVLILVGPGEILYRRETPACILLQVYVKF